jgi:Tol biopolymer transport system component
MDIYAIDFANIVRRLTSVGGINVSPRSPDGAKMTYVSNRSGAPQIYVQNGRWKEEESPLRKYNTHPLGQFESIAYTGQEDSG